MATETTDPITKATQALTAMEANAFRVRAVATRLLAEYAESLPDLLAVRVEASYCRAYLDLQPHSTEDTRQWAEALGVSVVISEEEYSAGAVTVNAKARLVVDGVEVNVASAEWLSPREVEARRAQAVCA